jgi:hypothetical protein
MTKVRDKKTKDFNQIKCIKDKSDRFLMKDDEIKKRWREYFDKLFNKEREKLLSSWMTRLIISTDDLFQEFTSLR